MSYPSQQLAGRVALVTGGAGGLGQAICQALAAEGSSVIVGYHRSGAAAAQVAAALPATPMGHAAMAAPVTDSAMLAQLATAIDARFGALDILVNCAGTTRFVAHADLDALDDTLIDEILATNVRGPFAAVRALRPLLARSAHALVVNISSVAATSAMGSNIMYCASKAAVDNMTRSLARALAPRIRVLSVAPGLVDTDFVQGLDANWRAEQSARTPLARLADPTEVARAVTAAATHLTFSTGAILTVDGGRLLA
ncbi:SDR family NAD(P)-dependent oxidoreductase [Undibacterium sp. Ji22W]|uniref:SDR family NAD(P)-dependent oxidoreductase n=1 Tax=Undibacterium sp. Ji22W TaxID=3413038 RepID=UPI003BF4331E